MRKLITAATIAAVCAAIPASATAEKPPQYWGGEMGDNLPGANITFKVRDGSVRQLQSVVRVRCHRQGGGPAPNAQLVSRSNPMNIVDGAFSQTQRRVFEGGRIKVAGRFLSGAEAEGFFKARYLIASRNDDNGRKCHTGKQDWNAEPMRFREWKKLRDYS